MFDGSIDHFVVFDRAPPGDVIVVLYNSSLVPEPATLGLLTLGGVALARRNRK